MPHLSINEELADAAASRAVTLARYNEQARREILGYLERLEVRLDFEVRQLLTSPGPSQERRARLATLLVQVRATIAEEYEAMSLAQSRSSKGLASAESGWAAAQFSEVAGAAGLGINLLTSTQMRALADSTLIEGSPARSWWEAHAGDLYTRFEETIREGFEAGESVDELVRRVRGRATGRRNLYELNGRQYVYVEFEGGLMDLSTRHAEALVRTAVQTVSARARQDTFAQNTDVVKGLVQMSTFDLRTTVTCLAYGGKAWLYPDFEPIDHDLPYLSGVPRHWNAIPAGELVATGLGSLPIEDVRVGDFVVTHRGRYRRVYATMSKPAGPLPLVGIETESGRVLWASQEHPVLTVGRGWQRADQVRPGDELLEHPEQAMESGLRLREVPAAQDGPPMLGEESFFAGVAASPGEVPGTVHFDSDLRLLEREVHDPTVDRELEHEPGAGALERAQHGALVGLRMGAVVERQRRAPLSEALGVLGRIAVAEHPPAMDLRELGARLLVPRSPMPVPGGVVELGDRESRGFDSRPELDAEASTGVVKPGVAEPEAAFDRSDRLAVAPVRLSNQRLDLGAVGEIQAVRHWHASRVRRVILRRDTRPVYNLAVAGDETYLAGGFVVHNCRSTEAPLLKSWQELGIDLKDSGRGVRWSRLDGDVPVDLTMDEFLRRRTAAQIDEKFGPGIAKLWREKRITLEDLVSLQTGRPLSLREIEAQSGFAA